MSDFGKARPSDDVEFWQMRIRIANYFGGAGADKEVQDLGPVDLLDLYDSLPVDAR